jgi:hypothetical protein
LKGNKSKGKKLEKARTRKQLAAQRRKHKMGDDEFITRNKVPFDEIWI